MRPSMSGMDWGSFLAVEFWALVTMASILASAVATLVGMVQRRRSRPEADWVIRPLWVEKPYKVGDRHTLVAALSNVGDGYAFRVEATGLSCKAVLQGQASQSSLLPGRSHRPVIPFVPLVEPGQEDRILVFCHVDDWDRAEVEIEWTRQPTKQRKRRSQRIALRDVQPAPEPEPDDREAASAG